MFQVETKEPNHASLHTDASSNSLAVHLGSLEKQKFTSVLFRTLLGSQRALTPGYVRIAGVHRIQFVEKRTQSGRRITTERRCKLETEQNGNEKMNLHGCETNENVYSCRWKKRAVGDMCRTHCAMDGAQCRFDVSHVTCKTRGGKGRWSRVSDGRSMQSPTVQRASDGLNVPVAPLLFVDASNLAANRVKAGGMRAF
jgi:hypothetical protein